MQLENMMKENPEALVVNVGGVIMADSLGVAEKFGKQHQHVLRSIDKLISDIESGSPILDGETGGSKSSHENYFIPAEYENRGKTYKRSYDRCLSGVRRSGNDRQPRGKTKGTICV